MTTRTPPACLSALPAGLAAGVATVELLRADAGSYPEWIKITPRGEVLTRDRRAYRIDPERLAAAFKADGTKPAVDIGHNTERGLFDSVPPPAIGWVEDMEARADGLYARVDWLAAGKAALDSRGYRYVSPCFWTDEDGVNARLVKSVALVTVPALGGLPALNSATGASPMNPELLAALGLSATATPAEALAVISALKVPDPTKYVPAEQLAAANAELTTARAELKAAKDAEAAARCAALVDDAVRAGKVTPAAKDHYLAFAKADFNACSAALAALPVLVKPGEDDETEAAPAAGNTAATLSADQIKIADSLGIKHADFAAALAAEAA
ncbi:MAG TPA: phage protease [Beijerinckiaceae bacterium]|nr:phage protease [Beijerinckiaceae bacterium]